MKTVTIINADDCPIDFYLNQNNHIRLNPGQSLTSDNPFLAYNPSLGDLIERGYIIIEFSSTVINQEKFYWSKEGF